MEISELLLEAAVLMITGMVVVFVFLTMLIFTIKGMSSLLLRFQDPVIDTALTHTAQNQLPSSHVAAIAAAVKQYREKRS
jgi:oxaloacetate decarboxylase gamma subunit